MHGTTKETANIVRLLGLFLNFVASRFLAENKRSFLKHQIISIKLTL